MIFPDRTLPHLAEPSLSALLRDRLAHGRPVDAVFENWASLEALVARDPASFAAALDDAARLDAASGLAAVIPRAAVGSAAVSISGDMLHGDPAFLKWFGSLQDNLAFRRLIRLALKNGSASGLVEAVDGSAVAVSAGVGEAALRWPISDPTRDWLDRPGKRLALLGFAPSRDSDLAARAAEAFGLTPLEARLAEALLDANNLNEAAARIGVGRETAREALKKAMRKAGAKRSPDLVRRLMDLMSGIQPPLGDVEQVLQALFAATPAEARAAARFAEGLTAREVGVALGLKEVTVRGQLKSVFAKTGMNKAKDLVRLTVEASALANLTRAAEAVVEPVDVEGRLRVVSTDGGARRIALMDYGPRGGRPVLVFHGASTGRLLPPAFVALLQKNGWRPIVPQRPGFGLTDAAPTPALYLEVVASDLAAVLDALKLRKVDILARDAGAAAALAFAERHPERVSRGLLVKPRMPVSEERHHASMFLSIARTLTTHPEMITAFAEMLRRQTRTDMIAGALKRSLMDSEKDRRTIADPAVVERLVRDAQGLSARSSAGLAAEMAVYARGWTVPKKVGGDRWTIAICEATPQTLAPEIWRGLPGAQIRDIADDGFLTYYSSPAEVVALLEAT